MGDYLHADAGAGGETQPLRSELLMVGIAPVRGQIHRTTKPLSRPGWAVTTCGIRKRLLPAEWRKPEDLPCTDCFGRPSA